LEPEYSVTFLYFIFEKKICFPAKGAPILFLNTKHVAKPLVNRRESKKFAKRFHLRIFLSKQCYTKKKYESLMKIRIHIFLSLTHISFELYLKNETLEIFKWQICHTEVMRDS